MHPENRCFQRDPVVARSVLSREYQCWHQHRGPKKDGIVKNLRFVLLLAVVALMGCTRSVTTTIRHPLQVGQLDANRIPLTYHATERQRGLPIGVLNDEAEILELTPERVCFDVSLAAIADDGVESWTDLRNFEIGLDAGSELHIVSPEIVDHQPTAQQYHGLNPQEQLTGYRQVCAEENRNDECVRWERQPVYETVYVPGIVTVHNGGGQICFGNVNYITPATEGIKLVLRRPALGLEFEWLFESILQ